MILAMTLLALSVVVGSVQWPRPRLVTGLVAVALVVAAAADANVEVVGVVGGLLDGVDVLGLAGPDTAARALLLASLVWCGPAADIPVRAALEATALPAPNVAAAAGVRAGRWIGRLERWLLVVVVAAGQPALAIIPTGGKALLRYAEAVADARAGRQRLVVLGDDGQPGRDAFLDYVLVGSLASWTQAVVLGVFVAG